MSAPTAWPEWVHVGDGCRIDPGVTLGYLPGRSVADRSLTIGPEAVLRTGTVIYAATQIGSRMETGHNVVIREENVIGSGVCIWSNSTVDYGCQVGSGVRIHNNVYVAQLTTLEDDVFLAPGVMIANGESKILINNEVYRPRDMLNLSYGLRLTEIHPHSITIKDPAHRTYIREF